MQISKILKNKTVAAMAVGLVCASAISFSAPAQAHGYSGCSTCGVYKKVYRYRHYYRSYGCSTCYRPCVTCYRPCNTCNTCYTYRCYGCGGGYYYGGYYY